MGRNCKKCGKEFIVSDKYPQKQFCSFMCAARSNRAAKAEEHYNWKGDKIKYKGIHSWVRREFGSASKCEMCGKNGLTYHWASINHVYTRKREDWKEVCVSCHRIMDGVSIPVVQLNDNFEIVAEYPSISSAGKALKRPNAHIIDALNSNKQIKGFFFIKKSIKK